VITAYWQKCVICLREELPAQQFNTWIKPLQATSAGDTLRLFTPNRFIMDWVNEHFLGRIKEILKDQARGQEVRVTLEIGVPEAVSEQPEPLALSTARVEPSSFQAGYREAPPLPQGSSQAQKPRAAVADMDGEPERQIELQRRDGGQSAMRQGRKLSFRGELNPNYTFANFIQGKSNQLARAAASQVASNPGGAYNPLFIYGGVGLGKTHLMHAIGNQLRQTNPSANVVYLHSQTFVGSMVSALQLNAINEFKRYYHSVDALLIDDIQFFANKERSQEEFFHTFNAEPDHPDLRPLSEGSRRSRGTLKVALRLGPDRGHRTAGTRNLRGDPHEQGAVVRHGIAR